MDGSDGVRNWAPAWAPPSALAADGMGPWGGPRSPRTGGLLPGINHKMLRLGLFPSGFSFSLQPPAPQPPDIQRPYLTY